MRKSLRVSALTSIITSYKERHYPYKPRADYYQYLLGLASELRELRNEPLTLQAPPDYFQYYVYLYLNPLKPGHFRYVLPSGKVITFAFEPFYVGKGHSRRAFVHLQDSVIARGGRSRKISTIKSIRAEGKEPKVVIIPSRVSDFMAQAFEVDIIAGIERRIVGLGPLANVTVGGDGNAGNSPSKATRKKQSISMQGKNKGQIRPWMKEVNVARFKGVPKTPEHRAKIRKATTGRLRTPEQIAQSVATRRANEMASKTQCPHCDFYGRNNDRWHFNNCKHRME